MGTRSVEATAKDMVNGLLLLDCLAEPRDQPSDTNVNVCREENRLDGYPL